MVAVRLLVTVEYDNEVVGKNCDVEYPEYVAMLPTAWTQYAKPKSKLVQFALISGLRK